jgi:lipase chaperone protein
MKNRLVLMACAVIGAGFIAALLLMRNAPPGSSHTQPPPAAVDGRRSPAESAPAPGSTAAAVGADDSATDPANQAPAMEHGPQKAFRVDASGALVVDAQTRLDIEALLARTDRKDLPQVKQALAQSLPAAAAAQALDLIERYDNYQQAQRQAYPPGVPLSTEDEALAQLEGLHALRVAHFGAETAQKFYGKEETISRSLIEQMRRENDQSLTLEEKAARIQQQQQSTPEAD